MDETLKLILRAHEGDKTARDQLVMDNVGLIWSIVRRFAGRGYEMEDLFQIGSIGLMKAIDKFDTTFEVKFSTYAVPMITGEIKRFLRDDGMIKVSRSIKELGLKVKCAREEMTYELGREPTIEEIAGSVGVSREEVAASMEAGAEVESLYRPRQRRQPAVSHGPAGGGEQRARGPDQPHGVKGAFILPGGRGAGDHCAALLPQPDPDADRPGPGNFPGAGVAS